jgi:hypothetical protein
VILSNARANHRPPTKHQSATLNTWLITLVVVVAAVAVVVVDRPQRRAPAAMEAAEEVEEEARQTPPLGAVVVVARVPSVLQAVLHVMQRAQLRPLACHTSPRT